jgi:transcriptional regulator with XRE-family HTH domain
MRCALAETVRSLRLKAGISPERLARRLGVDRANTAALEHGRSSPTLYTVCRLLPGLHVTFAEFAQELEGSLNREVPSDSDQTRSVPLPRSAFRRRRRR